MTSRPWLLTRSTDLAIKQLVRRQHRRAAARGFPRLAVVPAEHVGLAVTAGGLYEPDEIDLVKRLAAAGALPGTAMLDIGANIGNHTCALAPVFEHIVAFEPNPPIGALLKANVLLNNLANITIHEVGLSDADAELPFGLGEAGNDGSGSFAAGISDKTLPVRKGDDFLARHEPKIASGAVRLGFIKCDVQGFEKDVFSGLVRTLRAHQPVIMFESESRAEGSGAWAHLQAAGYTHLASIRSPGDQGGKLAREWARFRQGTGCTLEPVSELPDGHCNLLASTAALS
jgi:FkbM family methyltransferase